MLSLVESGAALEHKEPETPSNMSQPIAKQASTDVVPAEPSVQQEQTASLIDRTELLVEDLTALEPKEPETRSDMLPPLAKQAPTDAPPAEPLVQQEQAASPIDQVPSLIENVAPLELKVSETPSNMLQSIAKQTSADVLPAEPSVQQEQTASLIDQTLSLVKNVAAPDLNEPDTPSNMPRPIAKQASTDVLPAEPSVQQEQTGSLIDQTLSLVNNVAAPDLNEPETPSNMWQPIAKQASTDVLPAEPQEQIASLIDQTLWVAKNLRVPKPNPIDIAPHSPQPPPAKQLTSKERLDMDRAEIQKRVVTFKATQRRFQQDREEYYAMILAKTRATQSSKA
jgi:hypothetical protein